MGQPVQKTPNPQRPAPYLIYQNQVPTSSQPNRPAGFWRRLVARLLDDAILIFWCILGDLALGIFNYFTHRPPMKFGPKPITLTHILIVTSIVGAYYAYFYHALSGSPGKIIVGLRVVQTDSDKPISYLRGFLRETIGRFVSGILFLGYLTLAVRKDKRAFHDFIGKSSVIVMDSPQTRSWRNRLIILFTLIGLFVGAILYVRQAHHRSTTRTTYVPVTPEARNGNAAARAIPVKTR